MNRGQFIKNLFASFFGLSFFNFGKPKEAEEYHIVYWFDEWDDSQTESHDSYDEAMKRYDELLNGGTAFDVNMHGVPLAERERQPIAIKLVKTLRGFSGEGDLTLRGIEFEKSFSTYADPSLSTSISVKDIEEAVKILEQNKVVPPPNYWRIT